MRRKFIWLTASCLMALALLAAACAPAEEEAPTEKAPTEKAPAAEKEVTPAEKETATPATGKDMVKVSWKNGDGVMVEKEIERPQYGGTARYYRTDAILAWDEALQAPWTTGQNLAVTNEELVQGEWPRGPVVTNEVAWIIGGWMRESFSYGGLAESWEFPDDNTAIFHIRKGVHWHDKPPVNGREFNAHDAVFNIKRIYFDIKTSTMYGMAGAASRPIDVYAEDDYTVVVKAPPGQLGATWEYIADWTRMFPPEVIEQDGDHNQWEHVTGTGPFMLTDYVPMSQATWERNPNYWMADPLIPGNQLPYMDGFKSYVIPDPSTQVAALRTAKVDMSYGYGLAIEDGKQLVATAPGIVYRTYPASSFSNLGLRQDNPELPFYDLNVRRAVLMGINQPEIIDTYYGGEGKIVHQTVVNMDIFKGVATPTDDLPPAPDGFDNRKLYGYYPEEAKQMLADAGYPNGFKFEVVMQGTAANVDHMSMAAAYLERIGVTLEMDIKETGSFMSIYQRKTHKDALLSGRWAGDPHLGFCLRPGNMYNWAMVTDTKYDDYYARMSQLYFNEPERDKVLREMDLESINDAPYYMLPQGTMYMFWWPWVKNYDGAYQLGLANYLFPKYMWIDEDLKKSMGY